MNQTLNTYFVNGVTFIIFRGPSHPTHFIQLTVLVLRESECASLSPLAFSAKRKRLSRTRALAAFNIVLDAFSQAVLQLC